MTRTTRILSLAAVAAASLSMAQAASAASITATLNTVDPLVEVTTSAGNFFGGMFYWTRTGGDYVGQPVIGQNFNSFCLELTQGIEVPGSHTFDVVSLADAPQPGPPAGVGAAKATQLKRMWAEFFDVLDPAFSPTAFQLAIWEIVYEDAGNPLTLSGGTFNASAPLAIVAQANAYLSFSATGELAELSALTSRTKQDQIFETPGSETPIPLPPAAWAGLGLMAALAWKRSRKQIEA